MGETKVNTNSDHCKEGHRRCLVRDPGAKKTIDPTFLFPHLYASSLESTRLFYTQVLEAESQEMKDGKVSGDSFVEETSQSGMMGTEPDFGNLV